LFNILSCSEEQRDYDEFATDEDDDTDNCVSAVSSIMGGVGRAYGSAPGAGEDDIKRPDWENLDEGDHEINISNNLK